MKTTALFLAIYLFAGSLFPRTDFSQLAKAPNLLKHYTLHRALAEGEALSFFAFLKMHFFAPGAHEQAPEHQHGELPLYSIHSSLVFSLPHDHAFQLFQHSAAKVLRYFRYHDPFRAGYAEPVFHPPLRV